MLENMVLSCTDGIVLFTKCRLLAKFVVASRPCTVPPQDRPDPYTCKPDVVLQPGTFQPHF